MKVSFVIPFHNEEKNCRNMLLRVLNWGQLNKSEFEIIPVDDRSTDKTKSILEKYVKEYPNIIKPVFRKGNSQKKGNTMGCALVEGTKKASGQIIIWTMGDLADDIKTYTAIIDKIKDGYDLVIGSRYMPGGSRGNLDRSKAFLSSWGTILARFLFGLPVHDITNAFRGFKRNIFTKIHLSSLGFSVSPELAIKAYLKGFKLGEVPTVYTNRTAGISSFKLFNMSVSYLKLYFELFLRYKILFQRNETHQ